MRLGWRQAAAARPGPTLRHPTAMDLIQYALPAPRLQPYVSHYWLSRHNRDPVCPLLPDGAVDLVFTVDRSGTAATVHGTATARSDTPLQPGAHYLGISFRPGRSRHFLNASARALTDLAVPASGLLRFSYWGIGERLAGGDVFGQLDRLLEACLAAHPPQGSDIDRVVDAILAARGRLALSQAWSAGTSSRQLERRFLDQVGVPAKLFAQVVRFRHAAHLAAHSAMPLAEIAAETGYADQSHMTHAFRRFSGITPGAWPRKDVVFLQDRERGGADNGRPDQPLQE